MPLSEVVAAGDDSLAIERHFPTLRGHLARARLTELPTRVHRLEHLGRELGIDLWVKRDDESGRLYGGNKPRKLEFILGDAQADGKQTVMTFGGIGTHHGLATAICARSLGMKTILVLLRQPVTEHVRHSLLLDYATGAEMHYAASVTRVTGRALRLCGRELLRGELPYIILTGGTSPLGTIGYVNAAFELKEQIDAGLLPEPGWIFAPLGSGGTIAGLTLGVKLAGLGSKVVGVMVTDILPPGAGRLSSMARKSADILARHADLQGRRVGQSDFTILHGFVGAAYGAPTEAGRRARDRMLELEGIRLETTYTAKCMAGMIEAARSPEYKRAPVLFWNTYSSIDPSGHLGPLPDYHALPRVFHQFFEGQVELA